MDPSPNGIPVTEFGPSSVFSPIDIGFHLFHLEHPRILAPSQHHTSPIWQKLDILPLNITEPKSSSIKGSAYGGQAFTVVPLS